MFESALSWAERVVEALECRQQWELVERKQQQKLKKKKTKKKNLVLSWGMSMQKAAGKLFKALQARWCWSRGWILDNERGLQMQQRSLNISTQAHFYCPDNHCDFLDAALSLKDEQTSKRSKFYLTFYTCSNLLEDVWIHLCYKSLKFHLEIHFIDWKAGLKVSWNAPCPHG